MGCEVKCPVLAITSLGRQGLANQPLYPVCLSVQCENIDLCDTKRVVVEGTQVLNSYHGQIPQPYLRSPRTLKIRAPARHTRWRTAPIRCPWLLGLQRLDVGDQVRNPLVHFSLVAPADIPEQLPPDRHFLVAMRSYRGISANG